MADLGDKVRDRITGFTGVVVARTTWLFGVARCGVQAQKLREDLPLTVQWFDDPALEVLNPLEVVAPIQRGI